MNDLRVNEVNVIFFSEIELESSSVLHACLEHIEVTIVVCSELVVASVLEDVAVAKNEQDVAVTDRAQPVGDNDRGTPLHGLVQSLLNDLLTLLVQS